jgi:dienelactone hydrolase
MDPTMKREVVEGFLKSLDEGKVDYRFVQYAGAVHAFTNPDSDENAVKNGMQGMIGYSPSADRRSWEDMNAFFAEIFAPAKS